MACLGRYLYHWIQLFKSLAAIKKKKKLKKIRCMKFFVSLKGRFMGFVTILMCIVIPGYDQFNAPRYY